MKKNELAARIARKSHVSKATAADQLDRLVHDILSSLREGRAASLPGLGTFTLGKTLEFTFEAPKTQKKRSRG